MIADEQVQGIAVKDEVEVYYIRHDGEDDRVQPRLMETEGAESVLEFGMERVQVAYLLILVLVSEN